MDNKKPFIIAIIIMSVIIIGLGAYVVIDRLKEKEEQEKKTSIINETVIDLNAFFQVSDTLRRFDDAFNTYNSNYLGYIYNSKRIYASKFDGGAAVYASMISDLLDNGIVLYIPEEKIKGNFEKIFGKNLEFKLTDIDLKKSEIYLFNYEAEANRMAYKVATKTDIYNPGYIAMNIKTILEDDTIKITRKVFYGEYTGENGVMTKIVMYKDATKQKKIGELKLKNGAINQAEIIAKYGSKINTYIYTFKHNKDDDYSFYLIEKGK